MTACLLGRVGYVVVVVEWNAIDDGFLVIATVHFHGRFGDLEEASSQSSGAVEPLDPLLNKRLGIFLVDFVWHCRTSDSNTAPCLGRSTTAAVAVYHRAEGCLVGYVGSRRRLLAATVEETLPKVCVPVNTLGSALVDVVDQSGIVGNISCDESR